MENHHFQWVNPLQITIFNSYVSQYQRVSPQVARQTWSHQNLGPLYHPSKRSGFWVGKPTGISKLEVCAEIECFTESRWSFPLLFYNPLVTSVTCFVLDILFAPDFWPKGNLLPKNGWPKTRPSTPPEILTARKGFAVMNSKAVFFWGNFRLYHNQPPKSLYSKTVCCLFSYQRIIVLQVAVALSSLNLCFES